MAETKTLEEFVLQQRAALASNPECGTTHYNLGMAFLSQKKACQIRLDLLSLSAF